MKYDQILWNAEKDQQLQISEGRLGIGLSECAIAIEEGCILDDLPHPTRANQRLFILEIRNYAYVVPYVFEGNDVFLKTVFPSRKHAAKYLRKKS